MSRSSISRTAWCSFLIATLGGAVLLSGCAPTSKPQPTQVAPPETPTQAPTESSNGESLGSCDSLLPDEVVATLGSALTADAGYVPETGSSAAEIASFGGLACGWTDSDNSTSLVVAVAHPSADDLSAAETAFGGGTGTPTDAFGPGITAYTASGGGTFTGDIEVFTPAGYWISVVSPLFTSADSSAAKTVVATVLQALPAG